MNPFDDNDDNNTLFNERGELNTRMVNIGMDPFESSGQVHSVLEKKQTFIEIWREDLGRKKNTYVSGWNITDSEIKEHIKIIKKKNGCNGTLKEIQSPGSNPDDIDGSKKIKVIHLQGDFLDFMKSYLIIHGCTAEQIKMKG